MNFIAILLIFIVLNYGLTFILAQFISSAILISMIVDLVFAFVYPIFILPPPVRKRFYMTHLYWRLAGIMGIVFLGTTALLNVLF